MLRCKDHAVFVGRSVEQNVDVALAKTVHIPPGMKVNNNIDFNCR